MAFTPLKKWEVDDFIVQNFEDWVGGSVVYNLNHVYTGIEDRWVELGTVVSYDMSDFNTVVITHIDRASAKYIPLVEFSNGAKLCACLYAEQVTKTYDEQTKTHWCLHVEGAIKDPSGNYHYTSDPQIAGCIDMGSGGNVNAPWFNRLDLAKQYGVKFFFWSDYATSNGDAVQGQTTMTLFEVRCMCPWQSMVDQGGFQSFAGVGSNQRRYITRKEGSPATWVSDPQYIFYGYRDSNWGPFGSGWGAIFSINNGTAFIEQLNALAPLEHDPMGWGVPGEPNQEVDPSTTGGGGGNMDPSSDPIPFPELPVGGPLASGAIKAFLVDYTILTNLFGKLWDTNIFNILTQFQKLVDNPMDCIISLHCVPLAPRTVGNEDIIIGSFNTEVQAPVLANQYVTIDCGIYNLQEYWGSALDYNPYTKVSLYMPFIGIQELDVDDVMNNTVHIKYNIDLLTGDCLCNVMCGMSVLYKYSGNLKQDIPLSARTSDLLLKGIGGSAGAIAAGAMGGAVGGLTGAAIALGGGLSSAASVTSSKIHTSRSGSLSGSVGLLDDFRPFFILHRPVQSLAGEFKTQKGYPSNITAVLNTLTGYTEVEYIHLTGIDGATDTELQEIEQLLKSGVIL